MSYKTSLNIINSRDKEMILHVEPWGEQFSMPAGTTFLIIAEAEKQGELEIEYEEDSIVVYGWETSVVNAFYKVEEVPINHPEGPPVPEGTTFSSLIRSILRKFGNNE
jgi:hypothetical protein